ncbi:BTB POZ domain-containing 6-like [Paramuricea clavata]|uniref:BTB POZ domain-containing 6-like n=1 Tax=Paramuricea clavata TaxID=317549 RepID=A0A6S7HB21_PARCT|nr:BTB POZ domain-containing 6-like [Paramuricea clavata]
MASRYDDWQSSKKTVLQRNAYMFDNELMSDVSFTCGESSRIFHAHKYVLATSSAVFFALLYENLAEKEFPICIDDAEEESFEEFLRFLYTDACKITAENAIGVMYLAKKYLVSSLAEKCCEILEASIKPDNAFAVLKQAVQFEEKELEEKCWNIVSEKPQECINSEAFCEIGSSTLNAILKKETLSITEMELFKAILKWADKECERQGLNIEHDKTARRRILGDSVYEIPFLAMSEENFVKYISPTGILTAIEIVSISQKLYGLDVEGLKWKEHRKRQPCIVCFSKFDPSNNGTGWTYTSGCSDALALVVNKAVLFHGVRLFGSNGGQYEVKFTIKDKNVTGSYTSEQDSDCVPGYDVMLAKPIPLLPNEEITIIATITGPHSYHGNSGKSSVTIDDIIVTFKNAPTGLRSNENTNGGHFKNLLTTFTIAFHRLNLQLSTCMPSNSSNQNFSKKNFLLVIYAGGGEVSNFYTVTNFLKSSQPYGISTQQSISTQNAVSEQRLWVRVVDNLYIFSVFKPSISFIYHSMIMASRYHDDWQSSKKTVLQRNAYMFDNELMSDVSFTCGKSSRIFHAHKYVLATSSAVFFSMFYGNLAEKESPICIPDAEEESFEEFLRFLYTDACKITAENAISVMYLAKKYLVSSLAEKCCEILEASIKPDNAFAVLQQAVQFDEKELEAKCWNIVLEKPQECVNSEAFCSIGSSTLNAFLKKQTISLTEMELFKVILKWTDKECERQGLNIEHDKTARRRILGDSVYEIPFLAMSLENLVKYVSPTGILTATEILSISQKLCGLDVVGLKWKEYKKRQPCILSFSRFDPSNNITGWGYSGRSDALALVVNKAVLFHGARLFGSSGGRYEVKFTIKDKNVTGSYTSEQDSDGVPGYDVMLPNPIRLLPNEEITIIATIAGPQSYYDDTEYAIVKIILYIQMSLKNSEAGGADTRWVSFNFEKPSSRRSHTKAKGMRTYEDLMASTFIHKSAISNFPIVRVTDRLWLLTSLEQTCQLRCCRKASNSSMILWQLIVPYKINCHIINKSISFIYHSMIMASRYHDDWQSSKKTVLQRNAYMLDNELMSDVSFTCGESSRIFHAHKYVLATSSAVFFAMFYGNLAEKESPICIPDAEEESFEEFLRFLYTDDCKITAENAIVVRYLAKKYLVSSLAEKCCEILEASIKPDNAFAVLKQAVQFDEKELEEKCWNIVSEKTQECINSEAFCSIGSSTLNAFLKKETFSITEMELFKAILKWTDKECERQGLNIEYDKTARRRILGDCVYEIPFLAMSEENFVKYVSPTGILTDTEIVSISQKLYGLDVTGLKWKEHKKKQPCFVSFSRFDPANVTSNSWNYIRGYSDALTLVVNKAVLFHGVRLFEQDSDGVPGYNVMLPNPIPLLPNEEITIIATITGPYSHCGNSGKSSVKIDDIVVTFKDAPPGLSGNETSKNRGQFYKIFLSEL